MKTLPLINCPTGNTEAEKLKLSGDFESALSELLIDGTIVDERDFVNSKYVVFYYKEMLVITGWSKSEPNNSIINFYGYTYLPFLTIDTDIKFIEK